MNTSTWLAALAAAERASGPGLTAAEIAAEIGVSPARVRILLQAAIQSGTVCYAGPKQVQRIDGRRTSVPSYTLTKGDSDGSQEGQ